MCGICGTAGFSNEDLLKKMCAAIVHRGPDSEGYFFDKEIALGIRRLSIIDLKTGDQPIHNEDESVWIVFNGEIYNFRDLRQELESKGHRFYTYTDTEVIVHLYEEMGEDCVQALNGMFAFAIWDKPAQKLFIARDRIGVKPLYYTVVNANLLFASELKSLLEYEAVKRQINHQAIDSFLNFLYIPEPLSIFKNINKLPAGHSLVFKNGRLDIRKYWDLSVIKNKHRHEGYYCDKLRSLLIDAVRIRLKSDVPLGVFLSGGIDSSIITGIMAGLSNQRIKTFTIGYGKKDPSYNELEYARLAARHFNTEHHEYIIEPDLVKIVPKLVWHFDEPFADSSALPTFVVSQATRQKITVALSGIAGDEAFAGYPRYIAAHLSRYYQKLPMFLRRLIHQSIRNIPESNNAGDFSERAKRFVYGGMLPEVERYIYWISYLKDKYRKQVYSDEMRNSIGTFDARKIHADYFNNSGASSLLDKIYYLDVKTYLPGDLLFMADKMSMANSLELREPFCDYRLIEFSASIPYDYKIKGMQMKYLLKKTFKDLLPPDILCRKKHGFMMPVGRWLKDELKSWVMDLLSEGNVKKRGYFNYKFIKWVLDQHYRGKQNFDDQIWALIILEVWHQVYMD